MEVKRAHTHAKGWVEMECERCSTRYSCLLDEWGHADTGFLGLLGIVPSDDTMREAAQHELNANMRRSASRVPCPKCGVYGSAFVAAMQARAFRTVWWLAFIASTALYLGLVIAVWREAPSWTIFVILAAGWVSARIAANAAVMKADPNQNLDANRKRAQQAITKGIVKVESGQQT